MVGMDAVRLEVETPLWWIHRLWIQLCRRQELITFYEAYYTGQHPLPWLSPQAEEEFRSILAMSRSNYCGLVVDAQVERMIVEGFRIGQPSKRNRDRPLEAPINKDGASDPSPLEPDEETWRIWTANNMDSEFDKGLLEATINGWAYLLVAPNDDDPSTPLMYIEHPSQAIVEYVPGTNRQKIAAGLKVYDDDWTNTVHAVLYLPDGIYKWKQSRPTTAMPNIPISDLEKRIRLNELIRPEWTQREVGKESWPAPNLVGEVTLYELQNNPRLLTGGRSELEDVTDVQDRINKTLADRIVTQDYGAFPQRWVSGWPATDASGTAQPQIETGRNRIVSTEVIDTKFGQWDAAPLDPYSAAKKEDVRDIASRTRTPAQYLLGDMSNVNGQTLKASESGLVAKVRQRCRNVDDPLERAMAMVRKMAGLPVAPGVSIETIWRNPEYRTEGEMVDALTKMATLGVPQEALWERWGATPEERRRWKQMQDDAAQRAAETDPTAVLAARYRTLAGVSAQPNAPLPVAGGAPGKPGAGKPGEAKSATNNYGRPPGAPGVAGKAGAPGKNGRPRSAAGSG